MRERGGEIRREKGRDNAREGGDNERQRGEILREIMRERVRY